MTRMNQTMTIKQQVLEMLAEDASHREQIVEALREDAEEGVASTTGIHKAWWVKVGWSISELADLYRKFPR